MAGHGSLRPLDTASDPARSGLPGIQPGDPTAGLGGFALGKLTEHFQSGVTGITGDLLSGGGGGGEEGGMSPASLISLANKVV